MSREGVSDTPRAAVPRIQYLLVLPYRGEILAAPRRTLFYKES